MFSYPTEEAKLIFQSILRDTLAQPAWDWLSAEVEKLRQPPRSDFGAAFVLMPRKTGKGQVNLAPELSAKVKLVRKGMSVENWSIDRIARTYLLMCLPPEPRENYVRTIENLFLTAEMNELIALYGALPLLAYPDQWRARCAEGIRSNIGQVLEAIMCDNPYPSEQLDVPAWNQLVLKAIFTEKPLLRIIGFRERANSQLAQSISDFAHERWAARREVNPLVWICVEKFIGDAIFDDVKRLATSVNTREQKAAALLCAATDYAPAKSLIESVPHLGQILEEGVTWEILARDAESVRV